MPVHGPRIDRAADRRTDLDFLEARLRTPSTRLLPMFQGQAFTRGNALHLTRVDDAAELVERSREVVWLGLVDGEPCFALDLSPLPAPLEHAALSGSELAELRGLLLRLPEPEVELALYARALFNWHERQQHCGRCGQPTRARDGGHVRLCTGCATQHFPRTDPCVLVLVCDGDGCLLARSPGWPQGMYSALAGFVEAGESLEQAVAREVLEEVGLELAAPRYVGSQPWPFPASLMVGFVARARGRTVRVDGHEIEAARWVSRQQLRAGRQPNFFVPGPGSLAGRLIAAFAAGEL